MKKMNSVAKSLKKIEEMDEKEKRLKEKEKGSQFLEREKNRIARKMLSGTRLIQEKLLEGEMDGCELNYETSSGHTHVTIGTEEKTVEKTPKEGKKVHKAMSAQLLRESIDEQEKEKGKEIKEKEKVKEIKKEKKMKGEKSEERNIESDRQSADKTPPVKEKLEKLFEKEESFKHMISDKISKAGSSLHLENTKETEKDTKKESHKKEKEKKSKVKDEGDSKVLDNPQVRI